MRELVLKCSQTEAELWSDALLEAGALSVSVADADIDTDQEQALFGEPGTEPEVQAWQSNILVALLADGDDPRQLLAVVDNQLGSKLVAANWQLRQVPDADWVRLTQAQFAPIEVDQRIWIVPSWHRDNQDIPAADDNIIRIELDPGLAFGTGSHPTTHLCLQWLAAHMPVHASVLDYGCGSGILAIAASKLGADTIVAVDIDPQAVQSTIDNAKANQANLIACLPNDLAAGQFPLVVANILANPLKLMAPMLAARVAAGGTLVLSGILAPQADDVAQAYANWLKLTVYAERDGWVCLVGQKPL